jgi:hypothetical protein
MAYDYDVDILAALWTGAEDAEEPYASFIADNPDLTDEVSENRILSTIELLRSHMELLQTRGEAKLLHESISKLFRHTAGGSNPWSDAAAITDAAGNVCNPVFPAFASIDITIGGVTNSHSSETGGDCQTVAAELNETLDATAGGETEQTTIDTTGATPASVSGTSFNINTAGDVTEHYVWFDVPGVAESFTVTPNGDVDGDLGETYFDFNRADGPGASDFYVWLSHDGRAEITSITAIADVDGALGETHFLMENAAAAEFFVWLSHDGRAEVTEITTIADVDGALGETHFNMETPAAAQFYVWLSHGGRAESMSLDFTGITGATLPTGAVAAAYFDIDSTTAIYRLWFSDGSTTFPAAGGRALVAVAFTAGDADTVIAGSVITALGADADFAAFAGTPVITGTLASVGNVTDTVDGAVATGASFATTTQGVDVAETDPAAEGTSIEAMYLVDDGAADIQIAVRTAIDANGSWNTAIIDADTFTMTPTTVGPANDTFDGDTGFAISTTAQGVAAAESAPGAEGTGIEVPYTVGDIGSVIGTAIRIAVGANAAFNTEGNDPVLVVNAVVGATDDAVDVDTGFAISTTAQGVDAAETDPAAEGTGVEVSYTVGDGSGAIGTAIRIAVAAITDVFAEGNDPVVVTMANTGDVGDVTDGASATGFVFAVPIQGVDASVDPAPAGRNPMKVSVALGSADSEIGSAIRFTVGENADFFVEGAGNSTELNTVVNGVTTDSADTDSGLGVSTTRQGVDNVIDAFPITAICIQPGNKLGFRAQEEFLTFTLANGGGGIIGPAGIIPGERSSKPKQVSDQGRDLALGHFAGTRRDPNLTS